MKLPLSILDVVPISTGMTSADALRSSVELARRAEERGFRRYWFAEHHGMPSIASSAPEILIAHVAAATRSIRVGSGGIMLQNHVPLKAAEAFHTLQALYPGRIDLGIGRAPGTDPTTSAALHPFSPSKFAEQLHELTGLSRGDLPESHPFRRVKVIPSDVRLPPVWLLGSSGASAEFAGQLGLGYGFASHFSPAPAGPALEAYRAAFRASEDFPEPHAILALSVICASSAEHAEHLAASFDLMWVRITRGEFLPVPAPEEALSHPYTDADRAVMRRHRALVLVGTPADVRARIEAAARASGANEVMITSMVHSPAERLNGYELLADEFGMPGARAAA